MPKVPGSCFNPALRWWLTAPFEMQWTLKQLKNSKALRLALGLLFAFCLAGFVPAASAQSSGTPLSDVTLEQFMNALQARYSNAQVYNPAWNALGTDVDVNRLPVVALLNNGTPAFFATIPVGPGGESLYYPLVASSDSLTNILEYLLSSTISNASQRVYNFLGPNYDSVMGTDIDSRLTTFHELLLDIENYVNSPQIALDSFDFPSADSPYAFQTYDLATPHWLTSHSGGLGDTPVSDVLFVQDPLVADAVEGVSATISDAFGDLFDDDTTLRVSIDENALLDLSNMVTKVLVDGIGGLSDTLNPSVSNNVSDIEEDSQSLVSNVIINASQNAAAITNQVNASIGNLTNDLYVALTDVFGTQSQGSTLFNLIPSLTIATEQGPSVAIEPLWVDLDAPSFTIGGYKLWQALRALCLLAWWVWWIVQFRHFFHYAATHYQQLLAS